MNDFGAVHYGSATGPPHLGRALAQAWSARAVGGDADFGETR
jgi:hypothetical protein